MPSLRARACIMPVVLFVLGAVLVAPAAAQAETTRAEAARDALRVSGALRGAAPVLVHGELRPLRAGMVLTEAAVPRPMPAATTGDDGAAGGDGSDGGAGTGGDDDSTGGDDTGGDDTSGGGEVDGEPEPWLGIRMTSAARLARTTEPTWLFWVDRAPHSQFQHVGGVVVLVGARTGRVTVTRALRFPPLVNGALPTFLRSTAAYQGRATRVFERARRATAALRLAAPEMPTATPTARRLARMLGAQRTCVTVFGDTLGPLNDASGVARTTGSVSEYFGALARLTDGLSVERYAISSRRSPTAWLARIVRERGCQHVLVYGAGASASEGAPAVLLGSANRRGVGRLRQQEFVAFRLRSVLDSYPGARFSVVLDVPGAARFHEQLEDAPNLHAFLAPANAGGASYAHVPRLQVGRRVVANVGNPRKLLEFTNDLLRGLGTVAGSDADVDYVGAQVQAFDDAQAASWLLGRAADRRRGFTDRVAGVRAPFVEVRAEVVRNTVPVATAAAVTTAEDTPVTITLAGTDADGEALTAAIVTGPTAGTLAGTGNARTYTPTPDAFGTDTVTFTVVDPRGGISAPATVTITVTPVADAPTVELGANETYTEDAAPTTIAPTGTITDPEGITGLTVRVTVGFEAGDVLAATLPVGISGSFDVGTRTLALTGTASAATWQAVLRSVTFETPSDDPVASARTITAAVTDGALTAADTNTVTVVAVNDAPVVSLNASPITVTEQGGADSLAPVTLLDVDDVELGSATIRIAGGFQVGDELTFGDFGPFTSSWNAATGVLTITGTATVADWQGALELVSYGHAGDSPVASKSIGVVVNDGAAGSVEATRPIAVTAVNDLPVVATSVDAAEFVEDAGAVAVDPAFTVVDPDSDIVSATVTISGNYQSAQDQLLFVDTAAITGSFNAVTGVLTLTGPASPAAYQAALRSVTFRATGDDPVTATRTVGFAVADGDGASNTATRDVTVTPVNDAPVLTGAADIAHTEGGAATTVAGALVVSDAEFDAMTGATVSIATGFQSGDMLTFINTAEITGVFDTGTGVLTLSGSATLAQYQAALRSVAYQSTVDAPIVDKTIEVVVTDGTDPSDPASIALTITPTNDAPVVTTTVAPLAYTENDPGTVADAGVTVTEPDGDLLSGARVELTGIVGGQDIFAWVDNDAADAIEVVGTGVGWVELGGAGTAAEYQAALRGFRYRNSSDNPATSDRTVEFTVEDASATSSNTATRDLVVTAENDAPVGVADAVATTEDATLNIPASGVLTNDTDAEGDTLVASLATGVSSGSLTFNTNGSFSYTPGAGFQSLRGGQGSSDSFTYLPSDGALDGNDTTVTITVNGAWDTPTDITYVGLVAENSPSASVAATLATTDADAGDTFTYSIVGGTDQTSFEIDGDELQTTAVFDFETKSSYLVRVRTTAGGGQFYEEDLTIQVGDVNEAPTGITLTPNVVADSAPIGAAVGTLASVDVDAADSADFELVAGDGDGDNLLYAVDGSTLRVAAALEAGLHTDTVRVRVTDSGGLSHEQVLDVEVIVNAAPTALVLSASTVQENASTGTAVGTFTPTDPDGGPTYTYTLASVAGDDDADNGSFSIVGDELRVAGPIDFEAGATRSIWVQVDDGRTGTFARQFDITVTDLNEAPTAVVLTPSAIDENVAANSTVGTLSSTDADAGNTFTYTLASGDGSADNADVNISGSSLRITGSPDHEAKSSYAVRVRSTDQGGLWHEQQLTVTVDDVDEAPVLGGMAMAVAYTENDPATPAVPGLTLVDTEGDSIARATVNITSGFDTGADRLDWTDNDLADGITRDTTVVVASSLVLEGAGTAAEYQAAMRAVTFENTSDDPSTVDRGLYVTAEANGLTGNASATIEVIAVDDPPTAVADAATVLEDAAATAVTVLGNDSDVEGDPMVIASASDPTNGTVVLTGGTPGAHTGLTYQPDANYCNTPPGTTLDTFTYTLNGGSSTTVSMSVTCVNDAPVADAETFSGAVGNTSFVVDDPSDGEPTVAGAKLVVPGDILAGDSDVDGPGPLAVTAETKATTDGGSVTIQNDGDFVYVSDPADACADTSDSFTYTVSDGGSPAESDTGTVTVNLAAACVWYVDNEAAVGGTGTSVAPFDTLLEAQTASLANHVIHVDRGNGTTTGMASGFTMKSGQRLTGSSVNLDVGADTLLTGVGGRPTITNTTASADVVTLASGATVRGVDVDMDANNGGGIYGTTLTNGVVIDQVHVIDLSIAGSEPGIELVSSTGSHSLSSIVVDTRAGIGLRATSAGTVNVALTGTSTLSTIGARALDVSSTNMGATNFDQVTSTGSSTGGVSLVNASGTVNLGDGVGADLTLSTSGGSALAASGTAAIVVPPAGTSSIAASNGPAIDVTGASSGVLSIDTLSSTASATTGITFGGTGTLSLLVGGGSGISGAVGTAVAIGAGTGNVLLPVPIDFSQPAASAVSVTNHTGGTVTISGNLTDSSATGGGISVVGNSATTVNFTGTTKQVQSSTASAVSISGNAAGSSVTFSNGGLALAAGAGMDAFSASGSGTVTVTGAGNAWTSSSGTVANIGAGSGDVTLVASIVGNGTGASALVTGRTAGTVTIPGAVTDATANNGGHIALANNTGATVRFVGGVQVNSGTTAGFTATGGGSVEVTGSANTINTTTGTALNVQNTTISANDLTFRSISADGGANGIVLNNTGTSGGLTITGNGGSCTQGAATCTGGHLQGFVGADGATGGIAIRLADTVQTNLSYLRITGGQNHGIHGTGNVGLTLSNVFTDGNIGTSNSGEFDESVVTMLDVNGAVSIASSYLTGGAYNTVWFENDAGAPFLDLDVSNSTFGTMQGSTMDVRNSALLLVASAGSFDADIVNNSFTYWWGNAVRLHAVGAATSSTATVTGNDAIQTSGALAGAGGIGVAGGPLRFLISDNDVAYTDGTAISVDKSPIIGGQLQGTIDNNRIGISGIDSSGSRAGMAIYTAQTGPGSTVVRITNNVIRQINGSQAIWLLTGDATGGGGTGTLDATVTGNNIQEAGSTPITARMAILLQTGRVTNDSDVACFDVGGAGALANVVSNFNTAAGGVAVDRLRVNHRFLTTARFPGYVGGTTDTAALGAYLLSRNTAQNYTNSTSGLGGGFTNSIPAGAPCVQPTLP